VTTMPLQFVNELQWLWWKRSWKETKNREENSYKNCSQWDLRKILFA
jgi:hypothetical protein